MSSLNEPVEAVGPYGFGSSLESLPFYSIERMSLIHAIK